MKCFNEILTFFQKLDSSRLFDIFIAIAVVVVSFFISSFVSFIIVKIFKLKNKDFNKMKNNPWYTAIRSIIICIGIYIAIYILSLPKEVNDIIMKIFKIIVILVISKCVTNFFNPKAKFFTKIKESDKFSKDQTMINFISKIIKTCIYIIASFLIISELGYDLSGIIAGLGLGGVIIALAAQDIAKNLFGGIAILTDKPFMIGDYIETEKYSGTVEDITFRSTRIRTTENTVITIPNSNLSNESIINWNKISKRRFELNINLPLETESSKITKITEKLRFVLNQCDNVIEDSVNITFNEIESDKIKIWIYIYTTSTDYTEYLLFKDQINSTVLKVLESEKIKLAYPGNNIYIK